MELLKRVRADGRFRSMAIVMVTTETEFDHMSAALEAGANEYIMKPFTPDILREKLALIGIGADRNPHGLEHPQKEAVGR